MEADAAGTVQKTYHGAVRWLKQSPRAAGHSCGPKLPVGFSLQTLSKFPRQLCTPTPTSRTVEDMSESFYHVLDVRFQFPWSHTSTSFSELRSRKICFQKRNTEGVLHRTSSPTYFSSRESALTCTWTQRPLSSQKREESVNDALRDNLPDGLNGVKAEGRDETCSSSQPLSYLFKLFERTSRTEEVTVRHGDIFWDYHDR